MSYLKRFITKRKIWFNSKLIRDKCLILVYHRISKVVKESDLFSLTVSPDNFFEHLNIIKKHFNVLSLSELLTRIKNKELSGKSIAITFDDGYLDNLVFAEPLLRKFQITATSFITTGYPGKIFWWDLLAEKILNSNTKITLKEKELSPPSKPKKIQNLFDEILSYFRALSYQEKQEFINEIYSLSNSSTTDGFSRSMTKDEIAGFSKSRFIEIGGHTVQHFPLSTLHKNEQCTEILSNKSELENIIQKEVNLFSFPHGDFNGTTINILENNSFLCGLAGPLGVADNNSDPYQLKRFSVLNWNKNTFKFLLNYWL